MTAKPGAEEQFAAALQALYQQAGTPKRSRIMLFGKQQQPPVIFASSTLHDWIRGKSVPANAHTFRVLVQYLETRAAQRDPAHRKTRLEKWERARAAAEEGKRRSRPSTETVEPPEGPEFQRWEDVRSQQESSTERQQEPTAVPPSDDGGTAEGSGSASFSHAGPPPSWPYCAVSESNGCRGRRVAPHDLCLAHLGTAERAAYLATLSAGADVDLRGTVLDESLLGDLINAVYDTATDGASLGSAQFDEATFPDRTLLDGATFHGSACFRKAMFGAETGFQNVKFMADAEFEEVSFADETYFNGAVFSEPVRFDTARFMAYVSFRGSSFLSRVDFHGSAFARNASFEEARFADAVGFRGVSFYERVTFRSTAFVGQATFFAAAFSAGVLFDEVSFAAGVSFDQAAFSDNVSFRNATFSKETRFIAATFVSDVWFKEAVFLERARFNGAIFSEGAWFDGATFSGDAEFGAVKFSKTSVMGPLACAGKIDLSGAVFGAPVLIDVATLFLNCRRARWTFTATLILRYATVDLSDAVLEQPLSVVSRHGPSLTATGAVDETILTGHDPGVRLVSLRGVDASHVVLTDIDLSKCRFAGAFHLDELRLEGHSAFALSPSGVHWHRGRPVSWTTRKVLAEEHFWRASRGESGWEPDADPSEPSIGPEELAPLYRQFRRSLIRSGNEASAADFYYGEMEMRRHDRLRPLRERWPVAAYWALSGYGLLVSRALGWLIATFFSAVLVMMLWGIPGADLQISATGSLRHERITLTTQMLPAPAPTGPVYERLTLPRFGKSVQVVADCILPFHSSRQALTAIGTYAETVLAYLGPFFVGVVGLASYRRLKS